MKQKLQRDNFNTNKVTFSAPSSLQFAMHNACHSSATCPSACSLGGGTYHTISRGWGVPPPPPPPPPPPQKLIKRIRALEFVEMRELLPEEWLEEDHSAEQQSCCNGTNQRKKLLPPRDKYFHLATGIRVPGWDTGYRAPGLSTRTHDIHVPDHVLAMLSRL